MGYTNLFPAHAGVILYYFLSVLKYRSFPRTRGGDPKCPMAIVLIPHFSPHTRG